MTDDEILKEYSEQIGASIAKYSSEHNLTELEHEKFAKRYKLRFIEGFRAGYARETERAAINMLAEGDSLEKVSKVTGLTIAQLKEISKK